MDLAGIGVVGLLTDAAVLLGLIAVALVAIRAVVGHLSSGKGSGSAGASGMLGSLNEILVFGNDRFAQAERNEKSRPQPASSAAPLNLHRGPQLIRDRHGNPVSFVVPVDTTKTND